MIMFGRNLKRIVNIFPSIKKNVLVKVWFSPFGKAARMKDKEDKDHR